jgi:hypothetical protein
LAEVGLDLESLEKLDDLIVNDDLTEALDIGLVLTGKGLNRDHLLLNQDRS